MITVNKTAQHATGLQDYEFKGLHDDTKPTEGIAPNSLFFELDTGDFYYFTGETWAKVGGDA